MPLKHAKSFFTGSSTETDGESTDRSSGKETITATEVALLTLLREANWELTGRQRLQKLIFILDEEHVTDGSVYSWRKYDYGPYSKQLNRDMKTLDNHGFVNIRHKQTFGGNTRYIYRLTEKGDSAIDTATDHSDSITELVETVQDVFEDHGETPISNLIHEVREYHPEYWENSVYRR